jgi:hypothetical protein
MALPVPSWFGRLRGNSQRQQGDLGHRERACVCVCVLEREREAQSATTHADRQRERERAYGWRLSCVWESERDMELGIRRTGRYVKSARAPAWPVNVAAIRVAFDARTLSHSSHARSHAHTHTRSDDGVAAA